MLKYFIALSLSGALAPLAAAQYGAVENVLSHTDPALAGAFREAQENMPVFSVPAPVAIGERVTDAQAAAYLPLKERAVLQYEHASSEFDSPRTVRVEYLGWSDETASAAVNMITFHGSKPKVANFVVRAAAEGPLAGDSPLYGPRLEFPIPLVYNAVWFEGPDRSRVAALNAEVQVPAGLFKGCLKIVTRLSGGDAGTAERYYAPGVGLVYERVTSEERQDTLRLLSSELP